MCHYYSVAASVFSASAAVVSVAAAVAAAVVSAAFAAVVVSGALDDPQAARLATIVDAITIAMSFFFILSS